MKSCFGTGSWAASFFLCIGCMFRKTAYFSGNDSGQFRKSHGLQKDRSCAYRSEALYTVSYWLSSMIRTICSISCKCSSGTGLSAVENFTQVPQEELRLLGTGITWAGCPCLMQFFLKRVAPKCEKKVAIYSFIILLIVHM